MSHDTAISPQSDDAEIKMRRNLGLDPAHNVVSVASPGNGVPAVPPAGDPMRGARQAIRSQAAAREYVERQLAHAEATVQDLRAKLHHARQEKDAAIESARSAAARKLIGDRAVAATESALTAEKASHERCARSLRDAQAVIRDLQARLGTTAHSLQTVTAELAAEREARRTADGARRNASLADGEPLVTVGATGKRRGRPPNVAAVAEPATEFESADDCATAVWTETGHDVADVAKVRNPVGRPRKIPLLQPVQQLAAAAENTVESAAAIGGPPVEPKGQRQARFAQGQEPVQWWVKGWKPGRA